MKNFRKPYLSIIMASIFLFVSCNQYDTLEVEVVNKFDYSAFNTFKENLNSVNNYTLENIITKINKNRDLTNGNVQLNKEILNVVNNEVGSNLSFNDEFLKLSIEYDYKVILNSSLDNEWISNKNYKFTVSFIEDLKKIGIEKAIKNYENTVLDSNLSQKEFVTNNNFINVIKSLNYSNPNLFKVDSNLNARAGGWRCALASVALVAATLSLAACATGVACALAITLVTAAALAVYDLCGVRDAMEK